MCVWECDTDPDGLIPYVANATQTKGAQLLPDDEDVQMDQEGEESLKTSLYYDYTCIMYLILCPLGPV